MIGGIFIGLGTNIGDKLANLRMALEEISKNAIILKKSHVYKTAPWGYLDQDDFNNMAIEIEADLSPEELLDTLKSAEQNLGRVETFRYGPRMIDMDILLYRDEILETDRLSVPHPRMIERAFVLAPLAEIAPDALHPIIGLTISELAARVNLGGVERLKQINL